jgi:hypothetical protein
MYGELQVSSAVALNASAQPVNKIGSHFLELMVSSLPDRTWARLSSRAPGTWMREKLLRSAPAAIPRSRSFAGDPGHR